jgi:hypothetical protein
MGYSGPRKIPHREKHTPLATKLGIVHTMISSAMASAELAQF